MDSDKTISTLNGLIETLKDGEYGFKTAAEGLQDGQKKSLFQQYSRQRAEMARELQAEVRRLGGDPEKAGSTAGAAHRGWINIKSVVTGKDDGSIIAEAERGEDSAKKMYEQALQEPLPTQTLALVREQSMKVHDAHDRVRALERATTAR
ncbi:MAG TPA: PA2169 family four-helix-bundle protein [Vicinamibacterales bacterium]|nr:PA2169 family four-helix-bundle protein [Vicinamibacterales bacterium]